MDSSRTDPLVVAAFFKVLASNKQVLESIVCLRLEIIGFDETKDTNALVDSLVPFKDNLQELYLFWNTGIFSFLFDKQVNLLTCHSCSIYTCRT